MSGTDYKESNYTGEPHPQMMRAINGQVGLLAKTPDPFVMVMPSDENSRILYALLHDVESEHGEWKGGEFLVRVCLPNGFPNEPIHFFFLTETTWFVANKAVCIDGGVFHQENAVLALGILGFARKLYHGMQNPEFLGRGINIDTSSTPESRKKASLNSIAYNEKHYPGLTARIKENFVNTAAKWVFPPGEAADQIELVLNQRKVLMGGKEDEIYHKIRAKYLAPPPVAAAPAALAALDDGWD